MQVQDNPVVLIPNENMLHNNINIHQTQHTMNDIERYIISLCPSLTSFCRNKVDKGKDVAYNEGKYDNCHKVNYL